MHIEPERLRELTDEVDQLHHESMRTVQDNLADVHFGERGGDLRRARRRFLKRSVVGGAVLTVGSTVLPVSRLVPAAWAQATPSDKDIVAFAQSVELAAVKAYGAAASSGKLSQGALDVVRTFAGHHQDHADAFGALLGTPDAPAAGKANQKVLATFTPKIQAATDEAAVLEVAYTVEEAAAATYYFALGALSDQKTASGAATILPVESQHAVVLATILKKPASDYLAAFQTGTNALNPDDYPVR
ncbi:MAG: ferritin-like domain-containing protein [Actinobacteria bacterium]|nr:ferritin-like domain-containing protein [Actinomycetota bacterium]